MDASDASTEHNDVEEILMMASRLEAQAHSAEWERVEKLAVRIKSSVMKISEHDRGKAVAAVLQSLARVQTLVLVSRHDLSDKLAEIQRGRVAVRAYDHFAGQPLAAVLR